MHFTEYCNAANTLHKPKVFDATCNLNRYSNRSRLGIFVNLSKGYYPSSPERKPAEEAFAPLLNTANSSSYLCRKMEVQSPTTVADTDVGEKKGSAFIAISQFPEIQWNDNRGTTLSHLALRGLYSLSRFLLSSSLTLSLKPISIHLPLIVAQINPSTHTIQWMATYKY